MDDDLLNEECAAILGNYIEGAINEMLVSSCHIEAIHDDPCPELWLFPSDPVPPAPGDPQE